MLKKKYKTFGRLVVIKDDKTEGSIYPLKKDICVMGRDLDCDVRFDNPVVSRYHCEILCDGETLPKLVKRSKLNSVLVNGNKIYKEHILEHNDVITIGVKQLRFELIAKGLKKNKSNSLLAPIEQICSSPPKMSSDFEQNQLLENNKENEKNCLTEQNFVSSTKIALSEREKSFKKQVKNLDHSANVSPYKAIDEPSQEVLILNNDYQQLTKDFENLPQKVLFAEESLNIENFLNISNLSSIHFQKRNETRKKSIMKNKKCSIVESQFDNNNFSSCSVKSEDQVNKSTNKIFVSVNDQFKNSEKTTIKQTLIPFDDTITKSDSHSIQDVSFTKMIKKPCQTKENVNCISEKTFFENVNNDSNNEKTEDLKLFSTMNSKLLCPSQFESNLDTTETLKKMKKSFATLLTPNENSNLESAKQLSLIISKRSSFEAKEKELCSKLAKVLLEEEANLFKLEQSIESYLASPMPKHLPDAHSKSQEMIASNKSPTSLFVKLPLEIRSSVSKNLTIGEVQTFELPNASQSKKESFQENSNAQIDISKSRIPFDNKIDQQYLFNENRSPTHKMSISSELDISLENFDSLEKQKQSSPKDKSLNVNEQNQPVLSQFHNDNKSGQSIFHEQKSFLLEKSYLKTDENFLMSKKSKTEKEIQQEMKAECEFEESTNWNKNLVHEMNQNESIKKSEEERIFKKTSRSKKSKKSTVENEKKAEPKKILREKSAKTPLKASKESEFVGDDEKSITGTIRKSSRARKPPKRFEIDW